MKKNSSLKQLVYHCCVCYFPCNLLRISTDIMIENMGKMYFYGGKIVPTHFSLWKDCRQTHSEAFSKASAARHWREVQKSS